MTMATPFPAARLMIVSLFLLIGTLTKARISSSSPLSGTNTAAASRNLQTSCAGLNERAKDCGANKNPNRPQSCCEGYTCAGQGSVRCVAAPQEDTDADEDAAAKGSDIGDDELAEALGLGDGAKDTQDTDDTDAEKATGAAGEPAEEVQMYQKYKCPESFDSSPVVIRPEAAQITKQEFHARISLTLSEPNRLCTLVRVTYPADDDMAEGDDNSKHGKPALAPIGRSYNARPWERVAGPHPRLFYHCSLADSQETCQVTLPALDNDESMTMENKQSKNKQDYVLLTYDHSLSERDAVARFLGQTTFGVTSSDLDAWPYPSTSTSTAEGGDDTATSSTSIDLDTTFARWIYNQMYEIPATSHREYFRRRLNSRFDMARSVGVPNHPCKIHSKWREFAFTERDYGRVVTIKPLKKGTATSIHALYVDDRFRTLIKDNTNINDLLAASKLNTKELAGTGTDSDTFVDVSASNGANNVGMMQSEGVGTNDDGPDGIYTYKICEIPQAVLGGELYLQQLPGGSCVKLEGGNMRILLDDETSPDLESTPNVVNLPARMMAAVTTEPGQWMLQKDLNQDTCDDINLEKLADNHPVFGRLPATGTYFIHDPHLTLLGNTLDSPLEDGGGSLVQSGGSHNGASMLCSNVPRTFLNEDTCRLSKLPSTCTTQDMGGPSIMLTLDEETVAKLSSFSKRYVYLMNGLRVEKGDALPPCQPGVKSRWAKVQKEHGDLCGGDDDLHLDTQSVLSTLIGESIDLNAVIKDIHFPEESENRCAESDELKIGVEVLHRDGLSCWKHVHEDHMSAYDFEYWTGAMHAGNVAKESRGEPNPIKSPLDLQPTPWIYANLTFPWHHPMKRWNEFKNGFEYIGRLGDTIDFRDLPELLRGEAVAKGFGVSTSDEDGAKNIVVCGSRGEVENDPTITGATFIPSIGGKVDGDLLSDRDFFQQRATTWTTIALTAPDQLRQRMAWAMAQLLVVSPITMENRRNTENFLTYYDIFTTHAFGNFRDILTEVSYSPIMADFLTFLDSRSASLIWEKEKKRIYADENYAREIMQLFTMGIVKLNEDGTPVIDEGGNTIAAYDNEDIMSYARAWTGFERRKKRSNVENFTPGPNSNRIDPLMITPEWRDVFPKTNLAGGFIGDFYPLCEDLPDRTFLRKGARYRLLGGSNVPEYQNKAKPVIVGVSSKNFKLDPKASSLYRKLCRSQGGTCDFANEVILDSNIKCVGTECEVDTVQVVEVTEGIFYEYVRPPCVEASFYQGGKVARHWRGESNICANPALATVAEACCPLDGSREAKRSCMFTGEKLTYRRAASRCNEAQMRVCDFSAISELTCDECCVESSYHWADIRTVDTGLAWPRRGRSDCSVQVKIRPDGKVAIVHDIGGTKYDHLILPPFGIDNKNFFGVYWEDGVYPTSANGCGDGSCTAVGEDCVCNIVVSDIPVFSSMPKKEEVMSNLFIGSLRPSAYDEGSYASPVEGKGGIVAYHSRDDDSTFGVDTIFQLQDEYSSQPLYLKNRVSKVRIRGSNLSFRNPPHFLSLFEPEVRDASDETEAVLETVFRNDNTAPFLANRMIQRFGLSNPSPRLVESVANSFRRGLYTFESSDGSETIEFGTGEYGDMAALLPALLLDIEFRTVVLDADPSAGSLNEPLLSVISFLRSMEYTSKPGHELVQLLSMESRIGQMAHEPLTVFSFFLPHYAPGSGPVSSAALVAPESQLLAMSPVVSALNGLFSLTKYGLLSCINGFGEKPAEGCSKLVEGDYSRAQGRLMYQPGSGIDAEGIINELATLLTAGRLSESNRQEIAAAYISREQEQDKDAALRLAQQLIAASPEFRTNGITRRAEDEIRPEAASPPTCRPYKAVVFLMLQGGADSYNMLVPHSGCTERVKKDMYEEYREVRQHLALDKGELLQIDANSETQPCSRFGLHPQLPTLQGLYEDKSAIFMANIGTPMTIYDNRLYGHEQMQTVCKQLDAGRNTTGTGILGRIADALHEKGVATGAVSINYISETLQGKKNSNSNMVVSEKNIEQFAPKPSTDTFVPAIESLNGASSWRSSVFTETWSSVLRESIDQNTVAYRALESSEAVVEFPKSSIGKQLQTVARLISSRKCRGVERDVFYVSQGGYDHHYNVNRGLKRNFIELDEALAAFVAELKEQETFDEVVVVSSSEFGRTIIPDSRGGSDHGWGGHSFIFGGSVNGGQILGQYPSDISENSELNLGRGRMMPTTSWEAMWNGIAKWFGLTDDALDEALPFRKYLDSTGTVSSKVYSEDDLFINSNAANADGEECTEEELASMCGLEDEDKNDAQRIRRISTLAKNGDGNDSSKKETYSIIVLVACVLGLVFGGVFRWQK